MTTQDVIGKFRAYLLTERCVSPNTYASYSGDLEQFSQFLTTHSIELSSITAVHLKKFLQHLHALNISARSVARKVSALKALFAYMVSRCGMPDMSKELHAPKLSRALPRYLSVEEIEQLFAAAAENDEMHAQRNKILLLLLYVSGMRVTELITLTINDLDPHMHAVSVDGKGGKQRMIPLPHDIFSLVTAYAHGARKQFLADHEVATDYLFPVIYGKKVGHLSRQTCWTIVNRLWRKTGSDKAISPHQLRHSLATHMLARGVDLRSLQLLLGHEQVTTVQIYTHLDVSHLRAVYDKKHPRS